MGLNYLSHHQPLEGNVGKGVAVGVAVYVGVGVDGVAMSQAKLKTPPKTTAAKIIAANTFAILRLIASPSYLHYDCRHI